MFKFMMAVLIAAALLKGCVVVPGVEPTDLSSVKEETATRAEVVAALGEPELSRATDQGRIDVYVIDRGAEDEVEGVGHPYLLPFLPIGWLVAVYQYDEKVDEQEAHLAVIYDKQDRVVEHELLFSLKTSEEAIDRAIQHANQRANWRLETEQIKARAAQGDSEAQSIMGAKDEPDQKERQKWLLLAAEQGDTQAMYTLGRESEWGSTQQLYWLCQAAARGLREAQFAVGRAFGEGRGSLEPDLIKSYLWFKAAAAPDQYQKKHLGESNRGHIGKTKRLMRYYQIQITSSQVAEAERLATDWEPNAEDCYEPDEAQAAN